MPSELTPSAAGLKDEPRLTDNSRTVLEARYLKKDENGNCSETPRELFARVARTIADVETNYGSSPADRDRWEQSFYDIMATGEFMPNSPTLMNAGREMGMLSACFVLPVRDSIVDIFDGIKHTAMIQKAGGGTGFAFDELRPTGDYIKSSGGTTSGPISFWRAYSEATNAIQQGAFRRGANMGMMYIHHPDILKFLHAKQDLSQFTNYNISVKVTDIWMDEYIDDPDSPHVVRNPRNGKAFVIPRDVKIWKYDIRDLIEVEGVKPVPPSSRDTYFRSPELTEKLPEDVRSRVYTKREIWDIIVRNAWQTGEPGVVFIDRINEHNPTPNVGRIEATNPCGEQPLLPYEACNLGSINLGAFVRNAGANDAEVDWEGLRRVVQVATRFLDNVIDANNYPLDEISRICKANRKIGLGIMGFADALFKLNVTYNSDAGVAWGERFMKFINDEAHAYSEQLARERGPFENWAGSIWQTRHNRLMRNAAVTTVAPTGTISIIANCSGGIEPLFSLAFMRNVLKGQAQGDQPLVEVHESFRELAQDEGFYSDELIDRIISAGTLAHCDDVPDEVKRVYVCAHDISPEWHMRMQAAFQKHCDSSISKTINFPEDASVEDVDTIYQLAYRGRCKGVTVYRNNCRASQPMALKKEEQAKADEEAAQAKEEIPTIQTQRPIEPLDLPEIVSGFRIRQMTPFGNMHVKITVDPHTEREMEVFAQLGKGGDVANGDLEAICRMVSLWLRAGGSLRHVVKQLQGIGTSLQIPTRTGRITSLGDGLACALKKYTRAKERFGLRALLLGEISPAEMDDPHPAPHTPDNTPVDRPVRSVTSETSAAPRVQQADVIDQRVKASAIDRSTPQNAARPSARAAAAGSNGNGHSNGNGNGHHVDTAVAVAELPSTEEVIELVESEAVPPPGVKTATIAEVVTSVRHSHDFASHYKVKCPECSGLLALQEGCRKCPSCGWAAC